MDLNFKCEKCNDLNWMLCEEDDLIVFSCFTCFSNFKSNDIKIKKMDILNDYICEKCNCKFDDVLLIEDFQNSEDTLNIICKNCGNEKTIFKSTRHNKNGEELKSLTNNNLIYCPKCYSTQITTGARGVNFTMGFIGASKTVNRCAKCGYTWKPHK